MNNKKLYLLLLNLLIIVSCQIPDLQKKQTSGIYKVCFDCYEDEFTEEEMFLYSNVNFNLNFDGSFEFSKNISKNSRKGIWWVHESIEFELVALKFDNDDYLEIGRCTTDRCLIRIKTIINNKVKYLPFIKIQHEFPEIFSAASARL